MKYMTSGVGNKTWLQACKNWHILAYAPGHRSPDTAEGLSSQETRKINRDKLIDVGTERVVKDYGDVLRRLGRE